MEGMEQNDGEKESGKKNRFKIRAARVHILWVILIIMWMGM